MAMTHLTMDGRDVGPDRPAMLIAEIGVNHDGNVDTAMRLVEAAWVGGADAVKLQLFRADRLVHPRARLADYQRSAGERSPSAMLKALELDDAAVEKIVTATRQAGMIPLATPFSPEDVRRVADLNLPAVKLASPDLVNPLLVDAAADLNVPLLLSTGAANESEIKGTVDRLRERHASFALLHCVSSYPTPDGDAELGRIAMLAGRYDCVVGYSDHTQNVMSGALAVAAGAKLVEKHLTHDRLARGPDHAASFDPNQFREYGYRLREAERMLAAPSCRSAGDGERDVRTQSRQSLVAVRTIRPGEPITRDALTCQRPGTGIPASALDRVLDLLAVREIPQGAMLDWTDLDAATSRRAA